MAVETPVRIGVVGLGLIAQSVHLPNLRTLRNEFTVTHVCDASRQLAETIADELPGKVNVSSDWHDVCADDSLDAVLLLTPGGHGEVALGALGAGKHVLAEKPLCVSQAEATELDEAARRVGRVLQVGYMKMYDPIITRANRELEALGPLRVVRVTVLHPSDEAQFDHVTLWRFADADPDLIASSDSYAATRTAEAIGGDAPAGLAQLYNDVLLGSVIHEFSLLRALHVALPTTFDFVDSRPLAVDEVGTAPPCLVAVADLGHGAQLQLAWNWVPDYPEYTEEVDVFGPQGRLKLSMPGPYLPAHRARMRVEQLSGAERVSSSYRSGHTTGFVRELQAFAQSVTAGRPVLSDAAGAREDLRCAQALVGALASRFGAKLGGEAAAASL
jgi:predicted dehydrogenase